jgi:hypothetical protein
MYILLNHGEINGNLCSHNGVVSYICPNYVKISPTPLESPDANTHCHAIEVLDDDIKEVKNGQEIEYWLWKGPNEGRYNENDKATLPISNGADCGHDIAAPAVEVLPLDVQFAAIIVQLDDKDLDSWPNMGEVHVKEWKEMASALLNKYAESKSE